MSACSTLRRGRASVDRAAHDDARDVHVVGHDLGNEFAGSVRSRRDPQDAAAVNLVLEQPDSPRVGTIDPPCLSFAHAPWIEDAFERLEDGFALRIVDAVRLKERAEILPASEVTWRELAVGGEVHVGTSL
jgi:hypothetical protein